MSLLSIDSGSVSVSRAFLLFGLSSRNISLALVHISMEKSDQLQISRIYKDMARALLMKSEIMLLSTSQYVIRHRFGLTIGSRRFKLKIDSKLFFVNSNRTNLARR